MVWVREASKASPVNLSSLIVDRHHVFKRRNMENVLSAEAEVTGKVHRTFNNNLMLG